MTILSFLKKAWKKIVKIVGILVAAWLLCPLPEISLIVGFLTGTSVHEMFHIPAWSAYAGSLIGSLVATLILRELGWIEKMKSYAEENLPDLVM